MRVVIFYVAEPGTPFLDIAHRLVQRTPPFLLQTARGAEPPRRPRADNPDGAPMRANTSISSNRTSSRACHACRRAGDDDLDEVPACALFERAPRRPGRPAGCVRRAWRLAWRLGDDDRLSLAHIGRHRPTSICSTHLRGHDAADRGGAICTARPATTPLPVLIAAATCSGRILRSRCDLWFLPETRRGGARAQGFDRRAVLLGGSLGPG